MERPRWHDHVLTGVVVASLVVGVWSLWGETIRHWLGWGADPSAPEAPAIEPGGDGPTPGSV